ncbi:uncharacterized protein IL334_007113 [Kwoniella shivajii]|uniref:Uncharacterized protein n=1 Tax=Kwoniella shivajii TaxID=564305 RepID=A0ABZ1D7S7_9TREE|nr:hypothetical protein IL334_007113 [Kwoniella shivajii]
MSSRILAFVTNRARLLLLLSCLITCCVLIYQHDPTLTKLLPIQETAFHEDRRSDFFSPVYSLVDSLALARPTPEASPSVLIFQHAPYFNPLHRASFATHKLYAEIWGYGYEVAKGSKVTQDPRQKAKTMNKLYALIEVLRDQLNQEEKERYDWIFVTDIDTLISNPSIPIHHLLPSPTLPLSPEPLFLASQDHNGLNAGVLIFRVDSLILDILQWTIDEFESTPDRGDGWSPSDQTLLSRALSEGLPQRGRELAEENGVKAHGLNLLNDYQMTKELGKQWWKHAKNGIVSMRFLWD